MSSYITIIVGIMGIAAMLAAIPLAEITDQGRERDFPGTDRLQRHRD